MEILGLIPARGGSKGIPGKNICSLAGRPLLAYTADAALGSATLSRVVLSTDDRQIAEIGRSLGLDVPFLRPAELSRNESPAMDVIQHALRFLSSEQNYQPDAVMLLQPTSPLRRSEHIDEAATLLEESTADSVVSVEPVPHQFNPVSVMKLADGQLTPFLTGEAITRRQDKPQVFARNGPAILLTRTRVLLEQQSLYGEHCRPLLMGSHESIDIDDPDDLEYAEFLLSKRSRAAGAVHRRSA